MFIGGLRGAERFVVVIVGPVPLLAEFRAVRIASIVHPAPLWIADDADAFLDAELIDAKALRACVGIGFWIEAERGAVIAWLWAVLLDAFDARVDIGGVVGAKEEVFAKAVKFACDVLIAGFAIGAAARVEIWRGDCFVIVFVTMIGVRSAGGKLSLLSGGGSTNDSLYRSPLADVDGDGDRLAVVDRSASGEIAHAGGAQAEGFGHD